MQHALKNSIVGAALKKYWNVFVEPIPSSKFNIFETNNTNNNFGETQLYPIHNILCKFVPITMFEKTVFIPLHHTYLNNIEL